MNRLSKCLSIALTVRKVCIDTLIRKLKNILQKITKIHIAMLREINAFVKTSSCTEFWSDSLSTFVGIFAFFKVTGYQQVEHKLNLK